MTKSFAVLIRTAVFTAVAAIVAIPASPAAAYVPNITKQDITDAGGYCKGERCFLQGRAYQCVNGARCLQA
jgi:hypothetical protein